MFQERYVRLVAGYATSHQDSRNKFTHFFGIPLVLISITYGLSVPLFRFGGDIAGLPISIALVSFVFNHIIWIALDPMFGIILAALFGPFLWLCIEWTDHIAAQGPIVGMPGNLVVFLGIFTLGWAFQFLGHYFEGKRPTFADNAMQGFMGPTFLVYEVMHAVGLRKDLSEKVEVEVAHLQQASVEAQPVDP